MKGRPVRSKKGGDENRLSINVLELLGTAMTALVIMVIRKERPARRGEMVMMRRDSSSAV